MSDRKFLVLVRAGDASLHPRWLEGDIIRTWDIIVNYFGENPNIYREDDILRIDSKGPKWPALHDLIADHQELIDRYEYVWFPDDDLLTDKQTINDLFNICSDQKLEVAQPSLTWNSHSSHMVTLRHCNSLIRYTNFVEIMAPCLSRAMVHRVLPHLVTNLSGWGIDFLWKELVDDTDTGMGIIDSIAIRHTRPVGGPNYRALKLKGTSPYTERNDFLNDHKIASVTSVHKVITLQGKVLEAKGHEKRFLLRLVAGCAGAIFAAPSRIGLMRQIYYFVRSNLVAAPTSRAHAE